MSIIEQPVVAQAFSGFKADMGVILHYIPGIRIGYGGIPAIMYDQCFRKELRNQQVKGCDVPVGRRDDPLPLPMESA